MKPAVRLFALVLFLTGMSGGSSLWGRTYRVGMDPWIGCSPLNVAEAKGMWRRRGLEVEVKIYSGSNESTDALARNDVDFCYEMIGSWVSKFLESGTPIRLLGECVWSNGGDKVVLKRGVDIKDLKGEPIGIYTGDLAVRMFLRVYLQHNGLDLSDFEVVPVKDENLLADSFISGRFKAIVHYDPQALRAEREGEGEVAETTASYPGCMPEGFAARADVLDRIPAEDVVKFFQGWIDSVRWCHDPANWKEYRTILTERTFKGQPNSEDDLREMAGAVKLHEPAVLLTRNGAGGGLAEFLDQATSFPGLMAHPVPGLTSKEFMRTEALCKAAQTFQ